ncbi:MAG: CPBP family intramembrane metalloprotease [Lachnospiraceae bacterium]|nr:CPBP family intramembrane metalloprotease [Lachnospiraceae bacterium]
MKIRIRRILLPVLAILAVACLIELPLMQTTIFGEEIILWDTLFRAILAVPVLFVFYREDRVFRREKRISIVSAAVFAAAGVCLSLALACGIFNRPELFSGTSKEEILFVGRVWLQLLVLLIASPLLEELFFRGVLFGRLKELFPVWIAVFVSAAVFGLYHADLRQGLYGFFMGLYLAFAMERSQTVCLPVLIHVAINGAAFVLHSV